MPNFTIRVQLMGDPTSEEYERLHTGMAKLGYGRTAQGSTNVVLLPHALYYGSSSSTATEVCNAVARTASAIQSKIKVFVAQTTTWSAVD